MQTTGFQKNVLTMFSGAVLSQLIPIVAAPVLTRLFDPTEFGFLATVVAIAALVSFISTGRYELAIVMTKDDQEASALATVCLVSTAFVGLITTFLIAAIMTSGTGSQFFSDQGLLLYAIPIFAFLLALGQIANAFAHRENDYRRMAAANVWQQIATVAISIVLGTMKLTAVGLLAGRLAGLISFAVSFLPTVLKATAATKGNRLSSRAYAQAALTHRRFPLFSLPQAIVSSLSRDLLIFAFTLSGQLAAAGLYGLTRMVLQAPIYLLTGSISQVYYKEAIDQGDTAAFRQATYRLMIAIAVSTTPAFMLLVWWAPDAFAVVFGERWREAGTFAAWLAFPVALHAITCWPSRLFEARGQQHRLLALQVVFDLLSLAVVGTLLLIQSASVGIVAGYAIAQVLFHLALLQQIFRICHLGPPHLIGFPALVVALALSVFAAGAALDLVILPPIVAFCIHMVMVSALSVAGILLSLRAWSELGDPPVEPISVK